MSHPGSRPLPCGRPHQREVSSGVCPPVAASLRPATASSRSNFDTDAALGRPPTCADGPPASALVRRCSSALSRSTGMVVPVSQIDLGCPGQSGGGHLWVPPVSLGRPRDGPGPVLCREFRRHQPDDLAQYQRRYLLLGSSTLSDFLELQFSQSNWRLVTSFSPPRASGTIWS